MHHVSAIVVLHPLRDFDTGFEFDVFVERDLKSDSLESLRECVDRVDCEYVKCFPDLSNYEYVGSGSVHKPPSESAEVLARLIMFLRTVPSIAIAFVERPSDVADVFWSIGAIGLVVEVKSDGG